MEKNGIFELINSRRTVHSFSKSTQVDRDLLIKGLSASLMAPNHKLTFPWRWWITGSKTRRNLLKIAVALKELDGNGPLSHQQRSMIEDKFLSPDHLLILGRVNSEDTFVAREDYASIACAYQNLSLYLWSEGIGTKWSTGKITRHSETYRALNISQEDITIEGFIWIGKPERIPPPIPRPKIGELLIELD